MERSALSYYFTCVIDSIATTFASFLLFLVFSSFIIPYPYTVILAVTISLLICLLSVKSGIKKAKKSGAKIKSDKQFQDTVTTLQFMSKSEITALTKTILEKSGKEFFLRHGAIVIKEEKAVIFLRFSFDKITKNEIVKIFNGILKSEKAVIVATDFDKDITEFVNRFNGKIILVNGITYFNKLKELNIIPPVNNMLLPPKPTKPNFIKNITNKKRAKSFFAFGTSFLLISFLTPYKIYYVIWGGLMLIYSIVLLLFGKDDISDKQV